VDPWNGEDWEVMQEEEQILKKFNLNQGIVSPHLCKEPMSVYNGTIHYTRPPDGFIKLNFDGASKGNPGPAGIGGLFRDIVGNNTERGGGGNQY